MLALQKVFLFTLLALLFPQTQTNPKQDLNDQLYEAVRKGDAAGVTAALDRGADVNAKFRYGTTVLFKAAERGNADVTKVLLDRGADVNVKDTFYRATALSWALQNNHLNVVRLLLEKGADGADDVLMNGVQQNKEDVVKMALESGKVKPESLTAALAFSMNANTAPISDLLKKAGATPPLEVDAAILQTYVGKYKGETGPEVTFSIKDGKFFIAGFTPQPQLLIALDKTAFRPLAFSGITLTFNVEGEKVASMTFKSATTTNVMKRIGD
ncbi:MAG TPA: ankyrin repeat domain-containing protein [Pyrinomonadaceae bacterium]|nr:ankyrin repeat domain-containing protein [Pyrinomonadaceae bacterium]